jgi:hypothetical protein
MSVPVSPLYSVEKRPEPKSSTKSQLVAHSGHQSEQSKHYHARVVGTNQQRVVDSLNPTDTIPNSRSFPGQ